MNNKTKICIVILLILCILGAIYIVLQSKEKNQSGITNPEQTNTQNTILNKITQDIAEENKIQNDIADTTKENIVENVIEVTNTTSTEVIEEPITSNEEKAKKIVQQDWGTTEGIYLNIDGIDESGRYIISVHESSTTRTLAFYMVNVNTGAFEKQ